LSVGLLSICLSDYFLLSVGLLSRAEITAVVSKEDKIQHVTLSSSDEEGDNDNHQLNIDSASDRNSKNIRLGTQAGQSRLLVTLPSSSDDDEDDEDEIREQLETLSRLLQRHSNMIRNTPPIQPPPPESNVHVTANDREQGI